MATARVFTAADQPVNINPKGEANPAGCLIENGQNVTFTNNSGSTISILFAQTAISKKKVFDDINNLAPGSNHTEAPLVRDITVNYNVSMDGRIGELSFAIEVGAGPLEISVTGTEPTPKSATVPRNGEIQFNATDYKCDITWLDGDPLNPQLNNVFVGQSNNPVGHEHGNVVKDFHYELTESSQLNPVDGGGTIKVT
jgi:hypothetical protein